MSVEVLESDKVEVECRPVQQVPRQPGGHFAKGYSGNPAGRHVGKSVSLTEGILARLKAQPEEFQLLVEATLKNAKEGNSTALAQVWDRLDGTRVERKQDVAPDDPVKDEEAILLAAQAILRKRERMAAELVETCHDVGRTAPSEPVGGPQEG